jgi:hypothetical protein
VSEALAAPQAAARSRVLAAARGDPRVPFATILAAYVVAGAGWLGFNRSPLQIVLTVAAGCALDVVLHYVLRGRELIVPLSAIISSLSLVLLLNYAHDPLLLFLPVFLTIGSKYLLTAGGRHVFNPSLFGVTATLLVAGDAITAAPAYQWGGTWLVSAFMVTAALALFVFRVGRGWLVGSFLVLYALQTGLRAYLWRHHLPPEMLFLGTLSSPPFFLFVFFMLTDPRTSPPGRRGQVAFAAAVVAVDLVLHLFESVFTFFYAAFAVGCARFLWLHGRALVREGPSARLRAGAGRLRAAAVLAALALAGGTAYAAVLRPHVTLGDPGFRLEAVPPRKSGLDFRIDPASLDLVDPRVRHVAKWLLSVGASVQAGDVDGDGHPDLFLTSPLARARDRSALFLNRGAFRFERVELPLLPMLDADPRRHGLPSGGLFLDADGDGDSDLLALRSFGRTRLLRNLLREEGRLAFEPASFAPRTTSVAANALDVEGDGDLDLVIGNVLPLHVNVLRLPAPAHPGDRSMLAFMHDGWHDADNGGPKLLFRNRGDGTFEPVDAGLAGTRWSLAIGTGDLNGDARTDLYVANDFGPDELFVSDGARFRRVAGRFFGEIGRDTYKGMNASIADLNGDGRLDVYVSNVHHPLQAEGSLLWINHGTGSDGTPRFRDEAAARGALNERRFGWGAGTGDLDLDGRLDVVQANGMVDDRLDDRYEGCPDYWYANQKVMQSGSEIHTYADRWGDLRGRCIWPNEARRVYLNRGGRFVDAAAAVGLDEGENSRGVALVDLDSDGRLDVVIANQHAAPTVLRNVAVGPRRAWVGLRLHGDGRRCNRDALGTRVEVAGQVREVQAANGFSAQGDSRLLFGLGAAARRPVEVRVRWCGRDVARYRLAPGRYHVLRQG